MQDGSYALSYFNCSMRPRASLSSTVPDLKETFHTLHFDKPKSTMKGKIILEEHIDLPEDNSAEKLRVFARNADDLAAALHEIHDARLTEMNANGVEMAIMSQNPPGPQGISDPQAAEAYAIRSNNYIAEMVDKAPDRFAAFAAVSMHDAESAAKELTRCVEELHMVGVMLHDGQEYVDSDGAIREYFYDDERYDVFWATAERLRAPVYLHPKPPLLPKLKQLYIKRPWLIGPTFSFTSDMSFHTMALLTSGILDRFPRLIFILGHMGEIDSVLLHRLCQYD